MKRRTQKPPPAWLRDGVAVDYCSVIGEPPTQLGLVVRGDPEQLGGGHWVVWLHGKSGCVSVDACLRSIPCADCATSAGCDRHRLFTCADCGVLCSYNVGADDDRPSACADCWLKAQGAKS